MKAFPLPRIALVAACVIVAACSSANGDYRSRPPDVELLHTAVQQMTSVIVYDIFSPPQRSIAAFWDCNPYVMNVRGHAMFATKKITPGGHWMGIVATAAHKSHASLMQSAKAYVRTAVALADGFISVWDEKFRSNLVRPETVINAYLDESWQPLLQTPPFPEYTSGHSGISTAAAVVLTDQCGRAGCSTTQNSGAGRGCGGRSMRNEDRGVRNSIDWSVVNRIPHSLFVIPHCLCV